MILTSIMPMIKLILMVMISNHKIIPKVAASIIVVDFIFNQLPKFK